MAIPFLNNLDISDNMLLNAKLHVTTTAPSAEAGQIYFDSTLNPSSDLTAKYYSNSTDLWVSLKEYTFPTGNYVTGTVTGTTPKPIITFDLNAVNGTAAAGERYLTKNNAWATVASIPGTYSWTVAGDSGSESVLSGDTISFIGGTNVTTLYDTVLNELVINSTDQFQGTVTSVNFKTDGDALNVVSNTITTSGTMTGVWQGASSQYVNGEGNLQDVVSIPGTYEWDIAGDSGTGTVGSFDTINFAGGTNVTTAYSGTTLTINSTDQFQGTLTGITEGPGITVTPSATSPTVAVDYLGSDNYLLEAGVATVASSEDIINFSDDTDSNVKKTTLGTIPVDSLTLVKNYIDSSVSGGVYYQGGYDATNDLTSPGGYGLQTPPVPNIIEIGWMYTVTVEGLFFGEQLRVGDVLIAEIDAPTSLSDWTTVQNNIDLATSSIVGLGNVVPGSSNTVTAPYTSGTATLDVVDSTPSQKGAVIVDAGTGISVSYTSGTATVTNTDTNTSNTFSGLIGDGALTSLPITSGTHGLGADSTSFMIQLVEVSSGETVYADVVRGASGLVTIVFAVAPALNSIRVLIQKIG